MRRYALRSSGPLPGHGPGQLWDQGTYLHQRTRPKGRAVSSK